jgi:hypothetical protein
MNSTDHRRHADQLKDHDPSSLQRDKDRLYRYSILNTLGEGDK